MATTMLRRVARRVLEWLWESDGFQLDRLDIALVNDADITEVNRKFLSRRAPTDVIAFLYEADAIPRSGQATEALPAGELIISTQRALAAAKQWRNVPGVELALYVVHGILHLSGHKDATATQNKRMRERESELMKRLRKEFALARLLPAVSSPDNRPARLRRL